MLISFLPAVPPPGGVVEGMGQCSDVYALALHCLSASPCRWGGGGLAFVSVFRFWFSVVLLVVGVVVVVAVVFFGKKNGCL